MKKCFKYRLYPNQNQEIKLERCLDQACFLYNQMLDIKQQIYLGEGINLSEFDLNNLLKDFNTPALHSQVKQNIPKRISEAFNSFFRRVKNKEEPGFPKFKKRVFYSSITFPQYKSKIKENKVDISKVGKIELVEHRPLEGKMKTLTIKKENNEWYAVFSCEECPVEKQDFQFTSEVEGLDVGIKNFLVSSDGQEISNPKWLRKSENKLITLQRRLSRKKKGSKNRKKARIKLNKYHTKISRQREDFHKKLARGLAMNVKYIGIESLNIQGMVKNHCLAKSINDCGWGSFFSYLKYYKTIFGGKIIEVGMFEPTSQTCSDCGHKQSMPLENRTFICENCSMVKDRDFNASFNIKKLTIKKLIEKEINFNTEGHSGIYVSGAGVRPFVFEQRAVGDEGETKRVEVLCNQ